MRLVNQIQFPTSINAIALDADRGRLAVALDHQNVAVCRISQGGLVREDQFAVPATRQVSPDDRVRFWETKLALPDEQTLLVARSASSHKPHERWVELIAIDLSTKLARGHFQSTGLDCITVRGGLVPCPPHHVLLGVLKTVLCIDLRTFQVSCSAREVNEVGDIIEDGTDPEDQLSHNGFAYDSKSGSVYFLCAGFKEAFVMRYRLESPRTNSGSEPRRFVLEERTATLKGLSPAGLCLNPAREGVTASLQITDDLIDLGGQRVTDFTRKRIRMLGLREKSDWAMPLSARLGSLWVLSGPGREQQIELRSEIARDFTWYPQQGQDEAGSFVTLGYRLSAGRPDEVEGNLTPPVYLDEQRVVVGTPSGLLLSCNIAGGEAEVIHDFKSRIAGLQYSKSNQLLVASCQNGELSALSTED